MKTRAQSIIEYVLLFMLIILAITVTHRYIYRSMNACLKDVQEGLSREKPRYATNVSGGPAEFNNPTGGGGGSTGDGGGSSGGGGGCFLKGTKITLADGALKAIEELKKGDMVLGYKDNQIQAAQVSKTFFHPQLKGYFLLITEDNRQIKVTGEHPIFRGKDYQPVRMLKPGDSIFLREKNMLKPLRIKSMAYQDEVGDLYNLDIKRLHNFFAEGVLFHNKKSFAPDYAPCLPWEPGCKDGSSNY